MFSRPSGVGCASGCDDGVAGVVAWLLVHGQVADVVSSVPSRRAGRGAGRIHPRFRHGDLPRARLVLRLVSHLVGRLVAIVLPSMCFSCVFFIPFSGGMRLLDLSPCPSRRYRLVVPSRRASRAVADRHVLLA